MTASHSFAMLPTNSGSQVIHRTTIAPCPQMAVSIHQMQKNLIGLQTCRWRDSDKFHGDSITRDSLSFKGAPIQFDAIGKHRTILEVFPYWRTHK